MSASRLPVVVYGASGYTGRLVSASLAKRGVTFAISGRDRAKLDRLAKSLPSPPEVIVAGVDDPKALAAMAARARVVMDCAGPFARLGPPVIDAALESGAHFLDITGETEYMHATQLRDAAAKARGIAIVNAVGFDVVPTDCAGAIAAASAGAPVTWLKIAFATKRARPTQGTTRSLVEHLKYGGMAWIEGAIHREPLGAERWVVPFPQPIGTRECLSVPIGDVVTAPKSTGAENVRGFFSAPRGLSRWAPLVPAAGKVMSLPLLRGLTERWLRTLPEGPTAEQRAESRFAVHAEATGPKGTRTAWVTGPDGYDLTAESAALCADLASRPDFAKTGVLSPSQAFGARPLLDGLSGVGLHWGEGLG
jgi:short subunit dehydrogenase-like uncharacterized protein